MTKTMARTGMAALAALLMAGGIAAAAESGAPGTDDASIRERLTEQGYEVRKIEREDGKIEVYALKDGKRVELYLEPTTGKVLRVKDDD